jgi:hypothetical protein
MVESETAIGNRQKNSPALFRRHATVEQAHCQAFFNVAGEDSAFSAERVKHHLVSAPSIYPPTDETVC